MGYDVGFGVLRNGDIVKEIRKEKVNNLFVKTFLGFAFLMLVLALALFLPAGSLSYWQAWAYLAVFAACTILITAYLIRYDPELLARRVRGGPTAETQ